MEESLSVQSELMKSLAGLVGDIRVPRARRVWARVTSQERFSEAFDRLIDAMGFSILCTITALDGGESIEIIYHLARPSGVVLNLSTFVPKDRPVIKPISDRFPAADLYEREMADLMGVQLEGLPPGNRYPLPDDWPVGQFPLRKDWKAPATAVDNGVREKPNA
jgi:membrane-bound hydrogenase subunit beta